MPEKGAAIGHRIDVPWKPPGPFGLVRYMESILIGRPGLKRISWPVRDPSRTAYFSDDFDGVELGWPSLFTAHVFFCERFNFLELTGMLKKLAFAVLLAGPIQAARADCFDDAALFHQVNPWILRGIASVESDFRPRTIVSNNNGSVDRGMTGINSVHLPELAKYGIGATDMFDACKSIYVAAWLLKKKMSKHGNNYTAVGAYHSETPAKRDLYAAKVRRRIEEWSARGWIRGQ